MIDINYIINHFFNNMTWYNNKVHKNQRTTITILSHRKKNNPCSLDGAQYFIKLFQDWVENNKGWYIIQSMESRCREKSIQELLLLLSKNYGLSNNLDFSFEPNEGPGPVDIKVSRGNDKTVIEIKLSSNTNYLHGYQKQLERYAAAEGTDNKIFVFIILKPNDIYKAEKLISINSTQDTKSVLIIINASTQSSASVSSHSFLKLR